MPFARPFLPLPQGPSLLWGRVCRQVFLTDPVCNPQGMRQEAGNVRAWIWTDGDGTNYLLTSGRRGHTEGVGRGKDRVARSSK